MFYSKVLSINFRTLFYLRTFLSQNRGEKKKFKGPNLNFQYGLKIWQGLYGWLTIIYIKPSGNWGSEKLSKCSNITGMEGVEIASVECGIYQSSHFVNFWNNTAGSIMTEHLYSIVNQFYLILHKLLQSYSFLSLFSKLTSILLLLLSRFSPVRLCATP